MEWNLGRYFAPSAFSKLRTSACAGVYILKFRETIAGRYFYAENFQDSIIMYAYYSCLVTTFRGGRGREKVAAVEIRVVNSRALTFPLSEYDQLADYLLFNAYSTREEEWGGEGRGEATHTTLAAVIRDNKSAPRKRKFRGTFVPSSRSYCGEIYFTSLAGRCYSILSHILATSDPPPTAPVPLFPLSIFVGVSASKICR